MPTKIVVIPGREPEGRIDPITGSEVIISAARSLRDGKADQEGAYVELPERRDNCDFCPGNEEKTPPELVSFRRDPLDPSSWSTRLFTNRYPVLALEAKGDPALGVNEIVIETRRHNGFLSSISEEEIAEAFRSVVTRYFSLKNNPLLEWFSIFKNYGKLAGASIEHPHFQIAVKGRIPRKFRERLNRAEEYFWGNGRKCLFCDQIERHRKINQVVLESEYFIVLVPFEARVPYHLRIFPKQHNPSFAHILRDRDNERKDFARILKNTVFIFKVASQGENHSNFSDPMYNFYVETAPYRDDHKEGIFHWHVDFKGKTTVVAGYEEHTGEYVNPTYPEEIAAQLREIVSANKFS